MMASFGLVAIIANAFATHSTETSFPYLCYICMAIIKFFIPSSGGIFMVEGPALGQAALDLGLETNSSSSVSLQAKQFPTLFSRSGLFRCWALPV